MTCNHMRDAWFKNNLESADSCSCCAKEAQSHRNLQSVQSVSVRVSQPAPERVKYSREVQKDKLSNILPFSPRHTHHHHHPHTPHIHRAPESAPAPTRVQKVWNQHRYRCVGRPPRAMGARTFICPESTSLHQRPELQIRSRWALWFQHAAQHWSKSAYK